MYQGNGLREGALKGRDNQEREALQIPAERESTERERLSKSLRVYNCALKRTFEH